MPQKFATYVLLLSFVNTMFFYELHLLGASNASLGEPLTEEAVETSSLVELVLEVWWDYSGKSDRKGAEDWLDQTSAEKDFISPTETSCLFIRLSLAPPLRSALDPVLTENLKEIIPPPPRYSFPC